MTYLNIVNIVFLVLFGLVSLIYIHFIVFLVVGLFKKKKVPHTDEKLNYGIIIPARNEEKVVGKLIESIRSANYPQDKLTIFVMAHNTTDNTANVARQYEGVYVYEYSNSEENTKGYGMKHLLEEVDKDFGITSFDGFFIFDADNILDKEIFNKMNDAFLFKERKCIITSFRNSKNFGYNMMSGFYGIYFLAGCLFEMRGRTTLNVSTRVSGTGYLVNSEFIKDGWKYVTLTEDWEFTADQIILGHDIFYHDDAEFFDEQPTTFKIMMRQRIRWSRGHLLVTLTRTIDLIKALFSKKNNGRKMSIYDILANILPISLTISFLSILQTIFQMFSFAFGANFGDVMLSIGRNMLITTIMTYIALFVQTIIIFIVYRKRIHGVPIWKRILLTILYPFFIFIQLPIDVIALFCRNLSWKVIPHKDETSIESINKEREK